MSVAGREKFKSHDIKKWAVTAVAALFLLLLYRIIFGFSAQDSEKSGGLSLMISEKCIELVNSISGRHWSDVVMSELAAYFEHPLRKLAHFSEYTCMGILVYIMLRPWRRANAILYGITVLWVFASAAFDEFHQYFVPGRYSSFADVLLDTCGGMFGILLCISAEKVYSKIKSKKSGLK
ncbi:MAG: VanZ family protein [Lachnospiraceae bacterium]|nr:VanZ family protein [Lachnospiraceae bacterium]